MGGGGRTHKAFNVRLEMSSVTLEKGLHGTEPVPSQQARTHRGAMLLPQGSLLAGAPAPLRPFSRPAAPLHLYKEAYVRKVLGQGERTALAW